MTSAFKKYFPAVLIATIILAVAHNMITKGSIWQSVVFSLSLIAFLRVVYYIKKCIGGEDSLIRFFEVGSASMPTVIIFPVIFGLLAYKATNSMPIIVLAVVVDIIIEVIMNFKLANRG